MLFNELWNMCTLVQYSKILLNIFTQVVSIGSDAQRRIKDYRLTRYALYLVLVNSDQKKSETTRSLVYLTIGLLDKGTQDILSRLQISFPETIAVTKEQITIQQIVKAFKNLRSVTYSVA